MTSVKLILLTLFLFLALAYPVLAKESTTATTRREQIQQKIASREAVLKAKLQTFRDQRKAALVAKINDTLAIINKKRTDQMAKYLDNMSRILSKLEDRVNRETPDIKNVDAARIAIADARAKIATASADVSDQAAKDYTIVVSSESTVREDAKEARDELHDDLLDLRKMLIEAKQAVANAIRIAHSAGGEATPSGQP